MTIVRRPSVKTTSRSREMLPSLFGEPELPDGFRYRADVLTVTEEQDLVRRFNPLEAG